MSTIWLLNTEPYADRTFHCFVDGFAVSLTLDQIKARVAQGADLRVRES